MSSNSPIDPVRINYFDIIEKVDKWANLLFLVCATLSIASTVLTEAQHPRVFAIVQLTFMATVVGLFAIDLTVKLRLAPRATDARAQDFLSHAYGQELSTHRTVGYYNNSVRSGMGKVAAQTFENTLFTKEISRQMLNRQIPWLVLYATIFGLGLASRETPLALWCTVSQVLFGEQIIVRFARLWWLQRRAEQIHEQLRHLYLSGANGARFDTIAMDAYTRYEISKSTASITLSSKVYRALNPRLTAEWDQLRATYSVP